MLMTSLWRARRLVLTLSSVHYIGHFLLVLKREGSMCFAACTCNVYMVLMENYWKLRWIKKSTSLRFQRLNWRKLLIVHEYSMQRKRRYTED